MTLQSVSSEPLSHDELQSKIARDLDKSGLTTTDIKARPSGPSELTSVGLPMAEHRSLGSYVIPYFDIEGKPIQFYRVRLFSPDPKRRYRQINKVGNHIYFPPNFLKALKATKGKYKNKDKQVVFITEGEKKAAAATLMGFTCIGLGGVYNWNNRIVTLPEGTEINPVYGSDKLRVTLPKNSTIEVDDTSQLAAGMQDFINLCIKDDITVIIVYDTDTKSKTSFDVQRAAVRLAQELRFKGIPMHNIRQLRLPLADDNTKMAIDDYLVLHGAEEFKKLVDKCLAQRSAFPQHPNPRGDLNNRLQQPKLTRRDVQEIGLSILVDLERRGRRLRDTEADSYYYFDERTKKLMNVILAQSKDVPLHETQFGVHLYQQYGISQVDLRVVGWLATLFTGEGEIGNIRTHKVINAYNQPGASIVYQISDSQMAIVNADPSNPIEIHDNGYRDILFESGAAGNLDGQELLDEFHKQRRQPLVMHWRKVLRSLNFKDPNDNLDLAALVFYASPWLLRWKGTQLPIELVIGEAGSGKSSLMALRQEIIRGDTSLVNLTADIKDWYASASAVGGLHVVDNVKFTGQHKDYRQRLSDEMCRLVTEPQPRVELRKLYTTSKVIRIPINTVFAVTAIEQPFFNQDLIQRSAIFELASIGTDHDSFWIENQKNVFGNGRLGWFAHHLVVVHKFLHAALVQGQWNQSYKADHRLINYEQALTILARIFEMEFNNKDIAEVLTEETQTQLSEADWTLEGLMAFTRIQKEKYPTDYFTREYTAGIISDWAITDDQYHTNVILTNSRRLGRYLIPHQAAVTKMSGLYPTPIQYGTKKYMIHKDPPHQEVTMHDN